jgi:hypothetical protein
MESITQSEVERLGKGIAGWGDIDCFGCIVAGPAWRAGRLSDRIVRIWARSDDWRWRRAALVSTVPLNSRAQGGSGDARQTLRICRMLVADRHDLVVKALSWALRGLAKRDPESVREFLSVYREKLAPRVLREVGNKLVTGLKNPKSVQGPIERISGAYTISVRLPVSMIHDLKVLAKRRDVPYQSLLKVFLAERLAQERRQAG